MISPTMLLPPEENLGDGALRIFVDADSFPSQARDLVVRMVEKRNFYTIFVANRPIPVRKNPHVQTILVEQGKDVADNQICSQVTQKDIVLTRDILLAERIAAQNIVVINHIGQIFDKENIRERRSYRDFSFTAHTSGVVTAAPVKGVYGKKELTQLANSLDRMMTYVLKASS